MNKTISVQMYKRPHRAIDCLDRLAQVDGIEDWTVRVFSDNPGHSNFFDQAMEHTLPDDGVLYDEHKGLKRGNKETIRRQFEVYGSDINVHDEIDVLLGDDALRFVEWCSDNLDLLDRIITLCKNSPHADPGTVHQKTGYFHCWGWSISKDFYYTHFKGIEDQWTIDGWATEVTNYCKRFQLQEVYSAVQQAKNVAEEGEGENQYITDEGKYHKAQPYTGESEVQSPETWELVGCLEERCEDCVQMKEFH